MVYIEEPQFSFLDYPSPNGGGVTIYFTGCDQGCIGCHNKELQEVGGGNSFPINYEDFSTLIKKECSRYRTFRLCLMGGDPLHEANNDFVKKFVYQNRDNYDICVYTGTVDKYVPGAAYVKTGGYNEKLKQTSEKTDTKFVLASTNQKLYDGHGNLLSKNGIYYF